MIIASTDCHRYCRIIVFKSREALSPEFPWAEMAPFNSLGKVEMDAFDVLRKESSAGAYSDVEQL